MSKVKQSSGRVFNVAIDPGYGDIKVYDGKNESKFVNAIAPAGESFVVINDPALEIYEFMGTKYYVGEQALLSDPIKTRSFSYLKKYAPLLIYKVLKELGATPEDEINLATGLSIKDWHKKDEFIESIEDNMYVNKEKFDNVNVVLIPQGVGAYDYYRYMNKDSIEVDLFGLIDIGQGTMDNFFFQNGKPINNKYSASDKGINKVTTNLINLLKREYNVTISDQDAKEILQTRQIRIQNNVIKLDEEIKSLLRDYCVIVENEMLALDESLVNKVTGFIMVGGGIYYLNDVKIFEHEIRLEEPEYANVKGYWIGAFANEQ